MRMIETTNEIINYFVNKQRLLEERLVPYKEDEKEYADFFVT